MLCVQHVLTRTRNWTWVSYLCFFGFAFENERLTRELGLKNSIFDCIFLRFAHFSERHRLRIFCSICNGLHSLRKTLGVDII